MLKTKEADEYKLLAERNYDLAMSLYNDKRDYDWFTTILYYSILMYAKYLFIKNSWPTPDTHGSNYKKNKEGWRHKIEYWIDEETGKEFQFLCNVSWKARYAPFHAFKMKDNRGMAGEYLKVFRDLKKTFLEKVS